LAVEYPKHSMSRVHVLVLAQMESLSRIFFFLQNYLNGIDRRIKLYYLHLFTMLAYHVVEYLNTESIPG